MLRPATADSELADLAARLQRAPAGDAYSSDTWLACAERGLTGLPIDRRWGGRSASLRDTASSFEAFAAAGAPPGLVFALGAQLWSVTAVIARFGSDLQRERWLPGLCSGTRRGAHAMTEPMSGSDAFAMTTSASIDGDAVRLDGSKTFVTNGPIADLFIVFATTDPALGWAGVGCYVVDRETSVVDVRPLRVMSAGAAPMAELALDGCSVPAGNRLGAGSGIVVFNHAMELERSLLAAGLIGLAIARLGAASSGAGDQWSTLWARAVLARMLVHRAADRLDAGRRAPRESCMAKLAASELWKAVADLALEASGPVGMLDEGWPDLADAAAGCIYSGTSEMQREMLGRGLGL